MPRSAATTRTAVAQAQNLLLNSQNFSAGSWTPTAITITGSATTDPFGGNSGTLITEDSTNNSHSVQQTATVVKGQYYTQSLYVKYASRRYFVLHGISGTFGSNNYAQFDLQAGTVSDQGANSYGATITSVGNGWYRITATKLALVSGSGQTFYFFLSNAATGGGSTYTGDGTSGCYIYGAQVVQANWEGPYTVTTASTVNTGPIRSTASSRILVQDFGTNAPEFNGSSSSVICLTSTGVTGSSAFSMGIWAKTYIKNAAYHAMTYNGASGNYPGMGISTGNGYLIIAVGNFERDSANNLVVPHGWNHFVFTFAGGAGGAAKLYMNGTLLINSTLSVSTSDANPLLRIGVAPGSTAFWNGKLRNAFMYSRELALSEVQDIYYRGSYSTTNLIRFYKMDEGSGTTIIDYSPQAINATASNISWKTGDVPMVARSVA